MQMTSEVRGGDSMPSRKNVLVIGGIVLIVILAALAGFFGWQYSKLKANPDAAAQETTQRLTREVGKLYQLPDEKPTVAQINDKEKLKDQPFFKNATNGDYLLIYTNNKLAILFREKENKLINVGPIAITPQQAADQKKSGQ